MKLFRLNGEKVLFNAFIPVPVKIGNTQTSVLMRLTPELASVLTKEGILEECDTTISHGTITTRVANKLHCSNEEADKFLNNLATVSEVTLYRFLIKECACILNKRRGISVTKAENLYYVNIKDGSITKLDSPITPSFCKMSALFVSKEDAEDAVNFLGDLHTKMFSINE